MQQDSPDLVSADKVSVHFENQKNGERNCIRHAARTHHDTLCPVRAGDKIIQRMRQMQANPDNSIYLYKDSAGNKRALLAEMSLMALCEFVENLPERFALGLQPKTI